MNPEHISPAPSPSKTKQPRREGEVDAGQALGDSGLHGVNITEDDLEALVKELGLTGADAEDLVKGLGGDTSSTKKEAVPPPPTKEDKKEEPATADSPTPAPQNVETLAAEVEKPDVSKSEEPAAKADEPEREVDAAEEPTKSEATKKAEESSQEGSAGEKAKSEPA